MDLARIDFESNTQDRELPVSRWQGGCNLRLGNIVSHGRPRLWSVVLVLYKSSITLFMPPPCQ